MVFQFVEGHYKQLWGFEKFFGHFQPLHPQMNMPACITSLDSFPVTKKSNSLAPPTSVNHNLYTAEGTAGKISTALSIFGKCYSDNDIRLIWQSYGLAGSFSNGSARTWLRWVQIIRCDTNHSWQHDLSEAVVTTTTSSHKELVRSAWA